MRLVRVTEPILFEFITKDAHSERYVRANVGSIMLIGPAAFAHIVPDGRWEASIPSRPDIAYFHFVQALWQGTWGILIVGGRRARVDDFVEDL